MFMKQTLTLKEEVIILFFQKSLNDVYKQLNLDKTETITTNDKPILVS